MASETALDPTIRRPFGPTGLMVTPICVGCAPLGNMPETFGYSVSEAQAREVLLAIFSSPINFLDTSAAYADGESERRIGLAVRELGGVPEGYVIGTKADRDLKTRDFSGPQMRRSVERSLRLLGMDRLPLCYLHDPEHVTFEEITKPGGALETLQKLKEEGIIEHLGIAGGPIDLMMQYVELGCFEAVITHNRYTLLNHEAEPLLILASRMGLAVVNAAPYGSGMLAKGPSAYPRYMYRDAPVDMVERARRMESACTRMGVPLAAAALQFSMRDPRVSTTIIGMTRPERLTQTIDLAKTPIPDELWAELKGI